jgi:hypothetical protein
VFDIEIDDSGLDPENEYLRDLLVVLMARKIGEAPGSRDTAEEGNVRPRHPLDEQKNRCDGGNDDPFQNPEQ